MVLKMTLQKAVADLGLEAEVENTDVSSAKGSQADVIFTSNELLDELKGSTKSPIYPIKKYMDLVEVKAVLEAYSSAQA